MTFTWKEHMIYRKRYGDLPKEIMRSAQREHYFYIKRAKVWDEESMKST